MVVYISSVYMVVCGCHTTPHTHTPHTPHHTRTYKQSWSLEKRTCNCHSLLFPPTQLESSFPHQCIILLRHALYCIMEGS